MREWWMRLRGRLHRRSIGNDVDQEIDSHLEFIIDGEIARGMTPEEARREALRSFGNVAATREKTREAWSFPAFETILQDVRYGLRGMRRNPAFTLAVVLTLALGIGANTAIFSVVYTVLLRPLPYPAAQRLVILQEATKKVHGFSVTWPNYQHWRSENHTFEEMAAREFSEFTLTGRGEATLTHALDVTSSFFSLVGAHALLGRLFTDADDRFGAPPTAVLSYEFWQHRFGGDPGIVGNTLDLNGKAFQVIGVLAPGPHLNSPERDLYLPLGYWKGNIIDRNAHGSIMVFGRLKSAVTLAAARSDLNAIMARLAKEDPGPENDHRVAAQYLTESITGDIRPTLLIITGAVGLVLLIACANVASLLLVRSTARVREIAIRTAIGAGARRLARQLLTENLLIACGGGALGLLLAWSAVKGLIAASPRSIPRVGEVTVDLPILLFALAVTVATGLLAGLAPVISAGHADIAVALKESSHATGARRGNSIRSAFVIAEIAITLVLVFAAALLLRSLITAETAYPGFVPDHVLALELNLPSPAYKSPDSQTRFYSRLAGEIRAIPGVVDAGVVMCPPAAGDCYDWFYSVTDKPAPPQSDVPVAFFNVADTHYLKTMRIALREGRSFTDADREGAPTVALVNEKFARQWWPNESAVGHRIKSGGPYMQGPVYEIVGVVGNVSRLGLDEKPGPEVILPFAQGPARGMSLMIRTAGDPQALTAAIRQRVAAVDHNLPIRRLRTLEENLADSLQRRRFSTILLAAFAGLAIFLSAIGIYGILNYWVAVREDDIAVRLALGAQQSAILRWAGSAVLRLAALGTILGLAGAWAASHALESMVYGVSPRNPVMMLAAIGGVLAIAAVAAAVPVWRAMKVDAVKRLHHA